MNFADVTSVHQDYSVNKRDVTKPQQFNWLRQGYAFAPAVSESDRLFKRENTEVSSRLSKVAFRPALMSVQCL